METTTPLPVSIAVPASLPDIEQMAIEAMPSPIRHTGASPLPADAAFQQPNFGRSRPQTFPELIVGSSSQPDQGLVLTVHGDARLHGTVTATSFLFMSDARLKHNISPLQVNALDALGEVCICQYQMNDDPSGQLQVGPTAQNLRKQLPDCVQQDPATGLLSVKLDKLVMYTLKGVQEAGEFLKELDARQRLGMSLLIIMMQQQFAQHAPQSSGPSSMSSSSFFNQTGDSEDHADSDMSSADAFTSERGDPPTSANAAPSPHASFRDDSAMVRHIMAELGEANPGMPVKVGKMLRQLGRQVVWDAFLEAQHTFIPAKDGTARSAGSTFLALLKKQEQSAKLRQASKSC